jgi:hypothetical protein
MLMARIPPCFGAKPRGGGRAAATSGKGLSVSSITARARRRKDKISEGPEMLDKS